MASFPPDNLKPSVSETSLDELIIHIKPLFQEENQFSFVIESPSIVMYNDVKLTNQNVLEIDDDFRNFFYHVGNKTIVISISTNNNHLGRKAVVWMPTSFYRVLVPCDVTNTIYDALKYVFFEIKEDLEIQTNPEFLEFFECKDPNFSKDLNGLALKSHLRQFKIGVLLVKDNQVGECDIYNNEATPDFVKFLDSIGNKICLKDWPKFSGGMDTNVEGTMSYFSEYHSNEVMFHVAPFLPRTSRKIIDNHLVVIIFCDRSVKEPLDLCLFQSKCHYVFIVIKEMDMSDVLSFERELGSGCCTSTWYHVNVATRIDVPWFAPHLPNPSLIRQEHLKDWLLTKCINGERTVLSATTLFNKKTIWVRENQLKTISLKYEKCKKRIVPC
eukprot:TRINITY_DN10153_c0_g1_i1.p1 TRINITY_DN10153_c0_g1~~TRINITY_DN10153_c0_g1_i1.p1  ORF type:complete len:385 (-),score=88.93 TRINITY_DN10153_c0_g1_i1:58-1212(-)